MVETGGEKHQEEKKGGKKSEKERLWQDGIERRSLFIHQAVQNRTKDLLRWDCQNTAVTVWGKVKGRVMLPYAGTAEGP